MPIISIIVPVYKVEQYLDRCVSSILAQTYRDFELILVDDGSPDRCGEMCDEWAKKDDRIRVVHKENGGLSSARNAGLDIATGEYIGFVDSDDYIHFQMYEILMHCAIIDKSDIICTNLIKEDIRSYIFDIEDYVKDREIIMSSSALSQFSTKYRQRIRDTVQTKLYKSNIFVNLRFIEGIIYEDAEILPKTLLASKNITILNNTPLYCYQINSNSITHMEYSEKNFSSVTYNKMHIQFFYNIGLHEQVTYSVFKYMEALINNNTMVNNEYHELLPKWEKYIIEYEKYKYWILKNCSLYKMLRIMIIIFPLMPNLARKILYLLSK